jgi:uncharacterized protein with GYD domain
MAHYLLRYRLTEDAWNALIQNPQDLREQARQVVETADLRLHDFWYAFGEHDCYLVVEGDRNIDVAVIAAGIAAGSGFRLLETSTLLTVEEMWEVLYRVRQLLGQNTGETPD